MTMIVRDNKKQFTPAPEGLFQGVCVDVVDLGELPTQWGPKPKVRIVWQIEEVDPETDTRFQVMKQYTCSLNEKATLRKDLECWRGRKFTAEELGGFDLEKLIGANCQLQIIHALADDGRIFANIQAIIASGRGPKITAQDYTRHKDRAKAQGTGGDSDSRGDEDIPF